MRSKATGTLPSLGCASVLFALALILLAPAASSTDHTDCETFGEHAGLACEEHLAGVAVVTVLNDGDVDVEDIA